MIHIAYTIAFVLVKCTMFNAIWDEGKHFRTQGIDDIRNTQDCGVISSFEGSNGKISDYCGTIQDIFRLDFRHFFVYVLDAKWQMNMVEKGLTKQ